MELQVYKLEGVQVSFLQTTLLSKASKIISIKYSLPKPVAKTIFQLNGTYTFHCISLHFIAFQLHFIAFQLHFIAFQLHFIAFQLHFIAFQLHFIAFLSLVGFYFIEVKVVNHKSAAGSSQFFLPVFSGCIYPTSLSIKWKFVGWTAPSTLHIST